MSHTVALDAADSLAKLIEGLPPGDEIKLTVRDRTIGRIIPESEQKVAPRRGFGACKGMLIINREDDEHLADFKDYM